MNADCIEDRKQTTDELQDLQILGNLRCSTKARLSGFHRQGKQCKILPAMELISNILQITLYLISSELDLFKENGTGTSQATFNKLQLPRYLREGEKLQNLVSSTVELFHMQTEMEIRKTSNTSAHLCYLPNSAHTAHLRFSLYSWKSYWDRICILLKRIWDTSNIQETTVA
jgi:hypothetical protein